MFEIKNSPVYPYLDNYLIGEVDVGDLIPGDWVQVGTDGIVVLDEVPTVLAQAHMACPVHDEGARWDIAAAGKLSIYRGHYYRFETDRHEGDALSAGDPLTIALPPEGSMLIRKAEITTVEGLEDLLDYTVEDVDAGATPAPVVVGEYYVVDAGWDNSTPLYSSVDAGTDTITLTDGDEAYLFTDGMTFSIAGLDNTDDGSYTVESVDMDNGTVTVTGDLTVDTSGTITIDHTDSIAVGTAGTVEAGGPAADAWAFILPEQDMVVIDDSTSHYWQYDAIGGWEEQFPTFVIPIVYAVACDDAEADAQYINAVKVPPYILPDYDEVIYEEVV